MIANKIPQNCVQLYNTVKATIKYQCIFFLVFPKLWSNGDDKSAEQKRNSRNPTAHNMNRAISHFDKNLQNRFYASLRLTKYIFEPIKKRKAFTFRRLWKEPFSWNISPLQYQNDIFCTSALFEDFWVRKTVLLAGLQSGKVIWYWKDHFCVRKIMQCNVCTQITECINMYALIMLDLFIINVDNLTMFIYLWFLKFTFWIRDALFGFQHSWLTSQKHIIQSG